jgi:hypothetical protein
MDTAAPTSHPTANRLPPALACLAGLALLAAPGAAPGQAPALGREEQALVDKAIQRGVHYIQKTRLSGTWADPRERFPVGYAALPALTLLECGVPASDTGVQRAAAYVRGHASQIDRTYELALSILFLDKLGDKKDESLIEGFTARLIAGQALSGGWGYVCPKGGPRSQKEMLDTLRQLEAKKGMEDDAPAGADQPAPAGRAAPPGKAGRGKGAAAGGKPAIPGLPERWARLAVFRDLDPFPESDPPGLRNRLQSDLPTDNSNTQFAILAMWAARRHGLPVNRSLIRIVRRFEVSQNLDGSWGYDFRTGDTFERPTMDCVGLLGLAVGHGLAHYPGDGKPAAKAADPRIANGFVALSRWSGPTSFRRWAVWASITTCCGPSSASACCTTSRPSPTRTGIAGASKCSCPPSPTSAPGTWVTTGGPARRSTPALPCCSSRGSTSRPTWPPASRSGLAT